MEVNTQTLAECLGVTKRMIGKLAEDGVIDRVARGKYDLADCVKKYIEFRISGVKNKGPRSLDSIKADHEVLKMRKTELSIRLIEGKLHRADDVRRFWTSMAAAVKSRLLAIPVKVTPEVAGLEDRAEIQKILSREIADALNEIADYNPADFSGNEPIDDEGEEDGETED